MNEQKLSRLKRPVYLLPGFVRQLLDERVLTAAYRKRPPYQQNDYISWIKRAKLKVTQGKRLTQMLAKLESDDSYMGMAFLAKQSD